jgi:prepilin peptidase CpaA
MYTIFWFTLLVIIIASVFDLTTRRIPNCLTFPAMIAGVFYHLYYGGTSGLFLSLAGLLLGFAVVIVFYMLGGMGAGDVKLMAAIGSLLGPKDVLFAAFYTAIAGGVYAILLLVAQRNNRKGLTRYSLMTKGLASTGHFTNIPRDESEKTTPLCYGVPIAIGTIIVLAQKML